MFIIMDQAQHRSLSRPNGGGYTRGASGLDFQTLGMAEYVVVIHDETYEVIKDRFTDSQGQHFPLEELPNLIKQRLVDRLKTRDQVFTDD